MADNDFCKCKPVLVSMLIKTNVILLVSSEGCSVVVMWILCRCFGLAALNYSIKVNPVQVEYYIHNISITLICDFWGSV